MTNEWCFQKDNIAACIVALFPFQILQKLLLIYTPIGKDCSEEKKYQPILILGYLRKMFIVYVTQKSSY